MHSAPGPNEGTTAAFQRSLAEIAGWDLGGARLLVEHCDAFRPGQRFAKGFLTLPEEIAAIRGASAGNIGININWGRSAIEGRSSETALEHIASAAEHGLLDALFFSGATDADTLWGERWDDQHIPPRASAPGTPLDISSASLLGRPEIEAAIAAAGDGVRIGQKISIRPPSASVAERIALQRASLDLIAGR